MTDSAVSSNAHEAIDARSPSRSLSGTAIGDRFFTFFCLVLAGYAVGSKGFAYLGYSPLFIGEVTLMAGVMATCCAKRPLLFLRSRLTWLLLAFMAFSAARTLPFVGEYGVFALRDAAFWGYGAFALITASLILNRPERLNQLIERYRRFIPVFLISAPLLWPAAILFANVLPRWPGTDITLLYVKAADFLVHLSGIAAFIIVGLATNVTPAITALLTVAVGLTGFQSRGGLLAFLGAFLVAMFSRPRARTGWSLILSAVSVATLLAISGLRLKFPGMDREISFEQFVEHVASTTGNSSSQDLENTKEWRLAWWATIVSYTFTGDYFWGGKGYGVNLADDDGFQVRDDGSLRSPHNVHMTVLARSGVPGLLLWLALQMAWAGSIMKSLRQASRQGERAWAAIFAALLAYWLALLVNGSFDVYLEGPTGGIWFWTIFGLGTAANELFRHRALDAAADQVHQVSGSRPLEPSLI